MVIFPSSTAASSFDEPLAMLQACHGRIQAQCATLEKLYWYLSEQGSDQQTQQTASAILRYFDTAGQLHHQDEEQDLFPLLLATNNITIHKLIARLLAQHVELNVIWCNLRLILCNIVVGVVEGLDKAIFDNFIVLNQTHIALENNQLLPLAKVLLTSSQVEHLGNRMSSRRGLHKNFQM